MKHLFKTNTALAVFSKNVLIPSKVRKWVQGKKMRRVKFSVGPSKKLLSLHSADGYPDMPLTLTIPTGPTFH